MYDLITQFWSLLVWMAVHPVESFFILVVEFTVMFKLYYKFNENKWLRVIFGIIFVPQNFVFNTFAMTPWGLEIPQETATTKRMKRWLKLEPDSKINRHRIRTAKFLCKLMHYSDPGHCD